MTSLLFLAQPISSPAKYLLILLCIYHGLQQSQTMAVFTRSLFSPLVCFFGPCYKLRSQVLVVLFLFLKAHQLGNKYVNRNMFGH